MSRRLSRWPCFVWMGLAIGFGVAATGPFVNGAEPSLKVFNRPLHSGRINPMLFGNFIELLDDLVPGMWAEMLNDRGFEGVVPPANWVYYDGSPTFCDRRWDKGPDWALGTNEAFNGPRCARITGHSNRPAGLTQSGLAVTDGKTYRFTGYLRGSGSVRVRVVLKSPLPDGRFDELASADLAAPTESWSKTSAELRANGTSDTTVFELRVDGKRIRVGRQALAHTGRQRRGMAHGCRRRDPGRAPGTHSLGRHARSIRAVIAGKTASAIRTSESPLPTQIGAASTPTTSASTSSANSARSSEPSRSCA